MTTQPDYPPQPVPPGPNPNVVRWWPLIWAASMFGGIGLGAVLATVWPS